MKLLILFVFLATPIAGSVIKFANRCMFPVDVFRTTEEGAQERHDYLNPGEKAMDKFNSGAIGFKNGAQGKMQAEFEINVKGSDWLNINQMDGFDLGMSITASNGVTILCKKANCDAAFYDDVDEEKKERRVPTGGILTLTFCP